MDCQEFDTRLDEYLEQSLLPALQAEMERHLEACPRCQSAVEQAQGVLRLLRTAPVEPMSPGFASRAIQQAVRMHSQHERHGIARLRGSHWLAAGLGGAIAASVVLAFLAAPQQMVAPRPSPGVTDSGVAMVEPTPPPVVAPKLKPVAPASSVAAITMQVNDTRTVQVVFDVPTALEGAILELELPDGLELLQQPGRRSLSWQANLQQGKNRLSLPIRALRDGDEAVVARIKHGEKTKEFKVYFRIRGNMASVVDAGPVWI